MSLEQMLLQFIEKKKIEVFNAAKSTSSIKTNAARFHTAFNEGKFNALGEIEEFINEFKAVEERDMERNIQFIKDVLERVDNAK